MRYFVILILVLGIGYLMWNGQEQKKEMAQIKAELKAAKTAQIQAEKKATPVSNRVRCRACKGEGKLMKWTNKRNVPYPCPICKGVGGRKLTVPPGKNICSDCHGMGHVFKPGVKFGTGNKQAVTPCRRCQTSGLVNDY